MKKYQVLLFDVDGTLLDFDKAERIGIERVLTHFGVPATEENVQKYHHLNKSYWQKLERGEITREQVLSLRFEDFFSDFGIKVNGAKVDGLYRQTLNESAFLLDGVMDLLNGLKNRYELHIVTNGVAETQYKRLAAAGQDKRLRESMFPRNPDTRNRSRSISITALKRWAETTWRTC